MHNQRGFALVLATIVALLCSIGTYIMLTMAASQARWTTAMTRHERARYLAQAGMVWATQRIWQDPAFCTLGPQAVALQGGAVEVTVTSCMVGPHQIRTRVVN